MVKKIIVVDDAENIRYLVKTTLELQGYNVTGVSSGEDALKNMKNDKPDLIVLDIMMPGMDGWEVCRKMKEELNIDVPVLMLTARADDASKTLSENVYKVKGYLTKPFLRQELVDAVKKIVK